MKLGNKWRRRQESECDAITNLTAEPVRRRTVPTVI